MQVSALHRYSIGIAAENKPLNTRTLNVTPVETLSGLDGELAFNPQDQVVTGTDQEGNRYDVKTTTDITLTAEWLPLSSNRVTPPDIRRGELVEIYRLADTDQYFWRCMGLRQELRRLETVILAINASPNEGAPGLDISTCYFLEVSSHKKLITLQTSQANGEPFGYALQLNTGEGQLVFEDTIGNSLFLDSGRVFWELINSAQTVLQLDRTNIYGRADNNIEFRAGNDVVWEAGNNMTLKAGNRIYQEAPTHATKATAVTVEATTHDVTCPANTYSGNLQVGGNLSIGGIMSIAGGSGGSDTATVNGNVKIEGNLSVTDTISCRRLNASESVNAPNL